MKKCKNKDLQEFASMLSTISQTNRLQILCLLNKEGALCVCDIMDAIQIKQNLVSHHLTVLKDLGLLTTRREGKNIFYALEKKAYQSFMSDIKNIFSI